MQGKIFPIATGFVLFLLSLYLAFFLGFNHFYEVLLTGLFLALFPFTKKHFVNFKLAMALYLSFVASGLFLDLLVGLSVFKLWHYSYSNSFEYILLYTLVYPLGGFVALQSFLLCKSFIKTENVARAHNLKTGIIIFTALLLLLIGILTASKAHFSFTTWAVILTVSAIMFGIISINAVSEILNGKSYVRELIGSPQKVILVTFISTYVNAFIHEYPNVFAGQWIYTAYANQFLNTPILGIPIFVLLIWPALVIVPVSIYYFLEPIMQTPSGGGGLLETESRRLTSI